MAVAFSPAAGSLRERVTIQRRTGGPDGLGGVIDVWTPIITQVSARIDPLKGFENLIAEGIQATQTYTIWIRASAAAQKITTADRIVNARTGLTYNIRAITNPDERMRFLALTCQTGVANT